MKVFILHTQKSETGPRFKNHLKNCEVGYNLPSNPSDYFIINYGRSCKASHLNKNIGGSKLEHLRILKNNGINVPEVYSFTPRNFNPFTIQTLRSIIPLNLFPMMVRKIKHFKGKDIIFLKTRWSILKRKLRISKRDFFVRYIPKLAEFRIHVLGNEAPIISKKMYSKNTSVHHPHVWSSPRGWTLEDYHEEQYQRELKELAIKAVKTIGYDFGAVDIGLGKDGKLYVFEVNSSPRLSTERMKIYSKFFRQMEKAYAARQHQV